MLHNLILIGCGVLIGLVAAVVIFRKDIFQVTDYNDGPPGIEKVETVPAAGLIVEKDARLKNLHRHLDHATNTAYPEKYHAAQREVIAALKKRIRHVETGQVD